MRQNEEPLISVLMGVLYQRESVNLLERSIHSVQDQTYSNWELLICDDGSTEAACRYLDETTAQDERIRLIRGCKKTDLASKLNWCLSEAKGSYIARMDDDDWSDPQRFEKQFHVLEDKSTIAFVGCNVRLCRDNHIIGIRELPEQPEARNFLFVQPFVHPTLMFRRQALEMVGGYCEESRCIGCEDYDILLRLYEAGFTGMNIQEPFLIYTLPALGRKTRTMALRWNEVTTRWIRFKSLGLFPGALPYVIKPVVVGMIPPRLLEWIKKERTEE